MTRAAAGQAGQGRLVEEGIADAGRRARHRKLIAVRGSAICGRSGDAGGREAALSARSSFEERRTRRRGYRARRRQCDEVARSASQNVCSEGS